MTKDQKSFTRDEVVKLIDNLLLYPDQLVDATENGYTDWDGERLLELTLSTVNENK